MLSVLGVYDFGNPDLVKEKFGVVTLQADGRVLGFQEKPKEPKSGIAATALCFFVKSAIPVIKRLYLRPHDREVNVGEIFVELLTTNMPVYGYLLERWFDIGSPEDLERARKTD